jgi:hypothetical protein
MKKQICTRIWIFLTLFFITGCSKSTNVDYVDTSETSEQMSVVETSDTNEQMSISQTEAEQLSQWEIMNRIIDNCGLNNAQDYNNEIEDMSEDAIVVLCQADSGKYTAYGFISPEYGRTGILIDNVIDGESNWNYFDELTWTYGDSQPILSEQGEYNVIFTYTKGNGLEQTIYFENFDTGTMSVKE